MYYVYIIVLMLTVTILNPNHQPGVIDLHDLEPRPIFVRIVVHNGRLVSQGGILPSYHTFSKCHSLTQSTHISGDYALTTVVVVA